MKGGYTMNKPMNFDENKYNEFVNLYKERTSFIRYAKDLGISVNDAVTYYSMACSKGDISTYDKILADEVIRLYNEGKSYKEIEEITAITSGGISEIIKKGVLDNTVKTMRKPRTDYSKVTSAIIDMYNSNYTYTEISDELGTSISSVRRVITDARIAGKIDRSKKASRKPTDEYVDLNNRILELIGLKKCRKDIYTELNISEATLYNHINNMKKSGQLPQDFSLRPNDKQPAKVYPDDVKYELVINLHKSGMTQRKIADKLGISIVVTHYIIRSYKEKMGTYVPYRNSNTINEIMKLNNDGLTVKAIAAKLGIKEGTVRTYMSRMRHCDIGKDLSPITHKSEDTMETIVALRNEGKTGKEIRNITGYSRNTIYNHLSKAKRNGIEITYDDARDKYMLDLIKPYYDEGLSASEIGRYIGYSHDTISNYIKLGIQKGYLVGLNGKPLPKYIRVSGMAYKLYKEGQTLAEIAFRLTTSEITVRRALKYATRMEENK